MATAVSARFLIYAFVTLAFALGSPAESAPELAKAKRSPDAERKLPAISVEHGLLTIRGQDVDLDALLRALETKTGTAIRSFVQGAITIPSVVIEKRSLEEAIKIILGASGRSNVAVEYIRKGASDHDIGTVYILPSAGGEEVEKAPPIPTSEVYYNLIGWAAIEHDPQYRDRILRMGSAAVPGLIELLGRSDDRGYQKLAIVGLLGGIGGSSALAGLRTEKARVKLTEETRLLFEALDAAAQKIEAKETMLALKSLSLTGNEEAKVYLDLLESENSALAYLAGEKMIASGEASIGSLMRAMRENRSPTLRVRGLAALSKSSRKEGFEKYRGIFEEMIQSEDSDTLVAAAETLAFQDDDRSRRALLDRLRSGGSNVRLLGIIISKTKDNRAVPILLDFLKSSDKETAHQALLVLTYYQVDSGELKRRLETAGEREKQDLLIILGDVGRGDDDRKFIEKYLNDPAVGRTAAIALNRFKEKNRTGMK